MGSHPLNLGVLFALELAALAAVADWPGGRLLGSVHVLGGSPRRAGS
jgi:hypothetical protein